MLILNDDHIQSLGFDWLSLTGVIEQAVRVMDAGDYAQPIKPYLRYGDPRNRIIAMPAYLGGDFQTSGIKWIASFPGNRERGLPRAHGVIVLNRADTGEPSAILVGGKPNALRTAAVSGLLLKRLLESRSENGLRVGIVGWGPIGRAHFDMCASLFGPRIDAFALYDLKGVDPASIPPAWRSRTLIASGWEEVYDSSGVLFTCTVADRRYINKPPAPGRLLMDVSLRDYRLEATRSIPSIIVDDWDEVCRENTDIELLHLQGGLQKEHVLTLADVVCREALRSLPAVNPILFCPMGMAVFDLAVACYLAGLARAAKAGAKL